MITELKKKDEICRLSPEKIQEVLPELKEVTLTGIIEAYLMAYAPDKYNAEGAKSIYSAFLNGEMLRPSLADLEALRSLEASPVLNRSLRITHLETFYPVIRDLCGRLFKEHNLLLSCGIYITPHEDAQCFLYHSDHQHILAYQLQGEKRWSFPWVNERPVRCFSKGPNLNLGINEGRVDYKSDDLHLKSGEALFVPFGYSHRAFNDASAMSVHLTFAEEDITRREVVTFLAEEILGISHFDERFFEEINFKIPLTYSHRNQNEVAARLNEFYTKTKILKYKFGNRAI